MTTRNAIARAPAKASPISSLALALLAASAISACTASPTLHAPASEVLRVSGRVVSVDRAPMAYDGDGVLVLSTDAQGRITVHVPARSNLCKAQGLDVFHRATVGIRIEAVGTLIGPSDIAVCHEVTHRLKVVD